jgi:hypothetical protein
VRGVPHEQRLRGLCAHLRSVVPRVSRVWGRRRVRRHDARLRAGGRVRSVLGGELHEVHGLSARVRRDLGYVRALHGERGLRRDDARMQRDDAYVSRVRGRRRVRRNDARLRIVGRLRSVLERQHDGVHGDEARVQHGVGCVPRVWRRRGVRRWYASVRIDGRVRRVLGHEQHSMHGRDARVQHGEQHVRFVRDERSVRRDDARVQRDDAHVSGLRGRWRVRWHDAGVRGLGRLRSVLGDERDGLRGPDAGVQHGVADLRGVPHGRAVRGRGPRVRLCAHVSGLRG